MTIDSKKQTLDKINQAINLAEKQQRQKAYVILQDCLQTMPDDLEVNVGFGSLCILLGESGHAIQAFSKAVQSNPDNPVYLGFLGKAYLNHKEFDKAETQLRKALELSPHSWRILADLGETNMQMENFTDALNYLLDAHKLKPSDSIVLLNLSGCLYQLQRNEEALEYVEKVIRIDPTNYTAYNTLGTLLTDMGRLSEAVEYLEKAIKLNKFYSEAYFNLCRAKKFTHQDNPLISKIKKILEGSMSANDRSYYCFSLAKIYDDCKQWDQSFAYARQANLLAQARYSATNFDTRNLFKSLKRVFSKDLFKELKPLGNQSEIPVFIIGMPRSGTSLVEQIISCHNKAAGAGELENIYKLADSISTSDNPKQYQQDWNKILNPESISEFAEDYLNTLRLGREKALRVTDKFPDNYLHLGLITVMFPNASIIHVIRDPLDTCISCYFQSFARSNIGWSCDPESITKRYHNYRKTIEYWKNVLPSDKIFDVHYEQLIEEPEMTTRKMLEHCKLDWDPECLNFYKSNKAVNTASAWQVRQPIYKTSIKRWRRYGTQVREFANGVAEFLGDDDRQYLEQLGIKLNSKQWWNCFGRN